MSVVPEPEEIEWVGGFVNSIVIKGRLARDPELRHTQSDIAVASFTVAVDRRFTPKGEEKQADFIDCVAWRGLGELVHKYFSKGKEILVRGSLQSRKWTDKNDNKRVSWEIIADEVSFCGPKQDGGMSGQELRERADAKTDINVDASQFDEVSDDDLPF